MELSQHVSPKSKVIGYDISSSQFPAKEQLPSNVQLEILNVMGGFLPRSAVSAFDIVHVRALVLAVKRGDLDLLISRLGMMLSTPPSPFLVSLELPVVLRDYVSCQ